MTLTPYPLDDQTVAFFLTVPQSKIVLLQAFFELYEGAGLVRTLNMREGLVCVLTTKSISSDCQLILDEMQPKVEWQAAQVPVQDDIERYLGYFSYASDNTKV